jgi:hypothetical protein
VGLYYDGLNCVNTLGAFPGTHTVGLFYMQIYNLPQDQRQSMSNTLLVCVGYEDEMKYYAMEQVRCLVSCVQCLVACVQCLVFACSG